MENSHPAGRGCVEKIFDSSLPQLNNFRVFRALINESLTESHFERSERVKRFIEVSPRRRHPKLCRARGMIQRFVTVCISPSLLLNWIHMPAFFFNFRSLDLSVSEGHVNAVLLDEMEIISGVESFDYVTAYF